MKEFICEVCKSTQLVKVLDLGNHPMCDDLVRVEETRVCAEYPIEIFLCEICLTAHQGVQIPKRELFPFGYHYRARFTADVLGGMQNLVQNCEEYFGNLAGKKVLDVGCNDGSLLDFFKKKGASTFGVEPTGAYEDASQKGHKVYNAYFDAEVAEMVLRECGYPDYITFTNVFAHIEDLRQIISALKKLAASHTVVVIENHYLGAVLDGNQFDTFYHEHLRTYSGTSFLYIAKSLGMDLLHVEFPKRYGGNIRVFIGNRLEKLQFLDISNVLEKEKDTLGRFVVLAHRVEVWKDRKSKIINDIVSKYGKIPAKAFPGRAAILIKLLKLTEDQIDKVYEKPGSLKIGHYLPGTRIPIVSDDLLFRSFHKGTPLLNLSWHISSEVRRYLADNGFSNPIVDIIEKSDFE